MAETSLIVYDFQSQNSFESVRRFAVVINSKFHISKSCPERVGIGYGRMDRKQGRRVSMGFIATQYKHNVRKVSSAF